MANIIIENTLRDSFTMISNDFARHPNLTPRAARVYIFLMSHTAGWQTSVARIGKQIGMSRDAAGAAIRDLEALGYVKREEMVNDSGQFAGMSYRIFAIPLSEEERASDGKTVDGKPGNGDDQAKQAKPQVDTDDGKTGDGKTGAGKPGHLRRPISKKTNLKETKREEDPPQPPRGGSGLAADSLTDEAPSKPAKKASGRAANQAHELPEGWTPPAEVVEAMRQERPDVDQEHELRVFHDYWPSQPGVRSRKKDWTRTYRNWIRNARPSAQQPANGHIPKTDPRAWSRPGDELNYDPTLAALLDGQPFPSTGHHQATEQFPQFGDPTTRQINHTTNGQ